MAERGFPLTQKMLMAFAWAIAKEQEVLIGSNLSTAQGKIGNVLSQL